MINTSEKVWGDMAIIAKGLPSDWEGGPGGRWAGVSIELRDRDGGPELSISGVVGHPNSLRAGDADTCGQCIDAIAVIDPAHLVNGWTAQDLATLVDYWRRWHLNGMQAACEHQRARGETWSTHPSAECPDCEYRLGSAWLHESLPPEVIRWAGALDTQGGAHRRSVA